MKKIAKIDRHLVFRKVEIQGRESKIMALLVSSFKFFDVLTASLDVTLVYEVEN